MKPQLRLPGVEQLIAVASGKGGVGKTTVTVNLALALQLRGARVGIFDADIYGPNVPLMLGIRRHKPGRGYVPVVRPSGAPPYVQPVTRFGLTIMSSGFLAGEGQVINPPPDAVGQMVVRTLRDVVWGDLDFLLLDLPPSAGQPQQDIVQHMALNGVIIVTTPQDLSLLDSARALQHFQQADVPVLGVVENMSYFICPTCSERHEIFQRSARMEPALLAETPLLGRIPLLPAVSRGINRASPLMHEDPQGPQARAFLEVADRLLGG